MNHSMHSEKHLRALSHAQLVHLIGDVLKATPSVKEVYISLNEYFKILILIFLYGKFYAVVCSYDQEYNFSTD